MVNFDSIVWKPHPDRPDLGMMSEHTFSNGWQVTLLRGDFSIHMDRARRAGKSEVFELVAWPPNGANELPEASTNDPLIGGAVVMQDMLNQVEKLP